MANHYLQFCEALINLTAAERKWLKQQMETVYVVGDREYAEDALPDDFLTMGSVWSGFRAFRDLPAVESDEPDDGDDAGFQHAFQKDRGLGWYLWMYAEENGRPERVAHLVQKFLRRFRPHQSWSLTYAITCSKSRLGEFAGGALFVTAEAIESLDAYTFIGDRQAQFDARHQLASPSLSERTPA